MPELGLLWGVMQRAILDATGMTEIGGKYGQKKKRNLKKAALDWVMSEDKSDFSFIWCCEHLKLKKKRLREAIITMTKTGKPAKQSNVNCNEVVRRYVEDD